MAAAKAQITLRGRFPAGESVRLVRRVSDSYTEGPAVKRAKVSKDSVLEFKGLEHLSKWWAVAEIDGQVRAVAVTAKDPALLGDAGLAATRAATAAQFRGQAQAQADQARKAAEKDPLAASPALGGPDPTRQIVTGPRGSGNARAQQDGPVKLTRPDGTADSTFSGFMSAKPSDAVPGEPQPHPRQEDAGDAAQRSNTLTGQATPVAEPLPRQDEEPFDAGKVAQRSDTPQGTAVPKPEGEPVPSGRQEDVPESVPQRSNTPRGEAVPVPGARTAPSPKKKKKKKGESKAKGREFARRSAAAKKAAQTRKRSQSGRSRR